ncbi:MAG: hypothetical protein EZS28_003647 [Streblomastix strix]|uniref:Uncharacterized protein n=1 Tax=Streblomastix strix TaxID=222440 RepID=A0A5J4X2Y4_9EUKA|nr:MAG: hypothetical protein EZS28_003647 [Streblomastix strix]
MHLCNPIQLMDYRTAAACARNDHSHPVNVETNASNIPIVNGVGANGTSAFFTRRDHAYLKQFSYDDNICATKFIKTGGLTTKIIFVNGDTTNLDNKLSRTYSGSKLVRLSVFPASSRVDSLFIEIKVYSSIIVIQII